MRLGAATVAARRGWTVQRVADADSLRGDAPPAGCSDGDGECAQLLAFDDEDSLQLWLSNNRGRALSAVLFAQRESDGDVNGTNASAAGGGSSIIPLRTSSVPPGTIVQILTIQSTTPLKESFEILFVRVCFW